MRQLPHSIEAEVALLGTLLVYSNNTSAISEYNLQVDDFFASSHQKLFEHMLHLIQNDRNLEATILITRLKDYNVLSTVGGIEYISYLTDNSATPTSLKHYIEVVQEKAQTRRLILAGQEISDKGFDTSVELSDLLDEAEKRVLEITRTRRTSAMQTSGAVVTEVLENIRKMNDEKTSITGLRTGYSELDRLTSGLQKGDLIILAARPSMGKTAFALNLAVNAARLNQGSKAKVAIFSLEMPATHLMTRMLSARSGIPGENLRIGRLNDRQWQQLHEAADLLKKLEIHIDDSSSLSMPEVFSKCRKLNSEGDLGMIVIDYLQLITGRGKNENRQQEVSEISRALKQLARELKVPVVVLSQLSRLVERREGNVPQLSDLRESGSIEQDADIVMFLYRASYYQHDVKDEVKPAQTEDNEVIELMVKKHRNGALKDIELAFNKNYSAFYNYGGDKQS